jgi:hypothetical protein
MPSPPPEPPNRGELTTLDVYSVSSTGLAVMMVCSPK